MRWKITKTCIDQKTPRFVDIIEIPAGKSNVFELMRFVIKTEDEIIAGRLLADNADCLQGCEMQKTRKAGVTRRRQGRDTLRGRQGDVMNQC